MKYFFITPRGKLIDETPKKKAIRTLRQMQEGLQSWIDLFPIPQKVTEIMDEVQSK